LSLSDRLIASRRLPVAHPESSDRSGPSIRAFQSTPAPRSCVGVAFHRQDDNTYEAVYLRPFNFRAQDPARRQHAVQYIELPEFDFQPLRNQFPEEFENRVDASIVPTDWVRFRVVVDVGKVQIYVGPVKGLTLEVRKLGRLDGGQVGLWVGNDSGGDFANLVVTPSGKPATQP
jgi:hypothetical protein